MGRAGCEGPCGWLHIEVLLIRVRHDVVLHAVVRVQCATCAVLERCSPSLYARADMYERMDFLGQYMDMMELCDIGTTEVVYFLENTQPYSPFGHD